MVFERVRLNFGLVQLIDLVRSRGAVFLCVKGELSAFAVDRIRASVWPFVWDSISKKAL